MADSKQYTVRLATKGRTACLITDDLGLAFRLGIVFNENYGKQVKANGYHGLHYICIENVTTIDIIKAFVQQFNYHAIVIKLLLPDNDLSFDELYKLSPAELTAMATEDIRFTDKLVASITE